MIVSASDWIARVDSERERKLGAIDPRVIVDAPPRFRDYPKDYKECVVCKTRSTIRVALDGTNYYCAKEECQSQRSRRYYESGRRRVS